MFELAGIHEALVICDYLGCSQAAAQPEPYITAKKLAQIAVLCCHRRAASSLSARTAMAPAGR